MKQVHINDKVGQIIKDVPEMKKIMIELGFDQLLDPKMLATMGKIMTLKMGAQMKGINIKQIQEICLCILRQMNQLIVVIELQKIIQIMIHMELWVLI